MTYSSLLPIEDTLGQTLELLYGRFPKQRAEQAATMLHMLFSHGAEDDLGRLEPSRLMALAVNLGDFLHTRLPGQVKLRVFNPTLDCHGWVCSHSVVEIINDDMPFLVDSITMELARQSLGVHAIAHPILTVQRLKDGQKTDHDGQMISESLIHLHVDRLTDDQCNGLAESLRHVLDQVRGCVHDWQAMRQNLHHLIKQNFALDGEQQDGERAEAAALLRWIHADHFTFLGYRHFVLSGDPQAPQIAVQPQSSLGLLRDGQFRVFDDHLSLSAMPDVVRAFLARPGCLLISKSVNPSPIHRPVHMDIVGIKECDDQGRVTGLHAFVGLFTAAAYTASVMDVPLLRRKAAQVMALAGFPPRSHGAKALVTILETYPRDEVFQIEEQTLLQTCLDIVHLQDRPRPALFLRLDDFGRFASALIYLPRDRFDTSLRQRICQLLEQAFQGKLDAYYTQIADGPLARLHVVIRTIPGHVPPVDHTTLQNRIAHLARSWSDRLREALVETHGEGHGLVLARRWCTGFPLAYQDEFDVRIAVADVEHLQLVLGGQDLHINLYRPLGALDHQVRLKLLHFGSTVALSDILPILENMGLRVIAEVPYEIRPLDQDKAVWLHDFAMESRNGQPIAVDQHADAFETALAQVWHGQAESDGLNQLILAAGLDWRQVVILRTYVKYLRQTGSTLTQATIERVLADYPLLASCLVQYFVARFSPDGDVDTAGRLCHHIEQGLENISKAEDDRVLRRLFALIQATLRTNYFCPQRDYLSIKLASRTLDELPLPKPWVEVFVYSPRMEGIHLRGGPVARGGIRWSDRRDDFRTEILGLMKAQMVKNTVIVPVGAKGGFVVKQPPRDGGRDALQAEGIACYRTLIRGLLDITDSLRGGQIVPPPHVVRLDGDDPYLVVAADKGTATFSDIANAISLEYGFWLGDAFASGGSKGYDHKAMGITARGAWEAVKRHFTEMGHDTQSQNFTVLGVGDMSGDVFGNAMLLSPHIQLVGAFNHSHIFFDPNPDPARSFAERQRLFQAVKSWPEYDLSLISDGGGIFSRSQKSIPVTPPMRQWFGLNGDSIAPNALIQAMLQAPVDLLFFGGIGTYVKSTDETQAEVGDRANDAVRIDGNQIRAKVVGEGANLGVTQLGRVEYALRGGRINTDAIDNSAGVDTSDHEVNIKILLNAIVDQGDLTGKQRDCLLQEMTPDVAELVLRDNRMQTLALSIMQAQGASALDGHVRFMRRLEKMGRLNRMVECLPDDEDLAQRANRAQGFTRPELAILLAYAKIWLFDSLMESPLPADPALQSDLLRSFPYVLQQRFAPQILQHRLARHIVATSLTNSIINRVGISFVSDMVDRHGGTPAHVARAYILARDAFDLRGLWRGIQQLSDQGDSGGAYAMMSQTHKFLDHMVGWILRYLPTELDLTAALNVLQPGINALRQALDDAQAPLPQRLANLSLLSAAPDMMRIATQSGLPMDEIARLYQQVGDLLSLNHLRQSVQNLTGRDNWEKLSLRAMVDDLYAHQRDICARIAARGGQYEQWQQTNAAALERYDSVLTDLKSVSRPSPFMLDVAVRHIAGLAALL